MTDVQWILYSLWLVPVCAIWKLHHMTGLLQVLHHFLFGTELPLAAITAALVELTADVVYKFDLLVKLQVWTGNSMMMLLSIRSRISCKDTLKTGTARLYLLRSVFDLWRSNW